MVFIGFVALTLAQNPMLEQQRRAIAAEMIDAQEMFAKIERRLAAFKKAPPAKMAEFRDRVNLERASLEKVRAMIEAVDQAAARRDGGTASETEVAAAIEARELLFRLRARLTLCVEIVSPVSALTNAELIAMNDELFKKLESALAEAKRRCGRRSPFNDELEVERRGFDQVKVGLGGDVRTRLDAESALYAQQKRLNALIDSAGACSSP